VVDEPDGLLRPAVLEALAAIDVRSAVPPDDRAGLHFVRLGGLGALPDCRMRLRRRQLTSDSTAPQGPASFDAGPEAPADASGPADAEGPAPGLTVAYAVADPLCAALHALHGCADAYLVLEHTATGPRFAHLPWPHPLALAGITAREADVLALLVSRRTNAEIAERLVLAPATVRAHCRSIYRKLSVSRRHDLWGLATARP